MSEQNTAVITENHYLKPACFPLWGLGNMHL